MSDLQSYLDMVLKEVDFSEETEDPIIADYNIEEEIRELVVTTRIQAGITQKQLAESSGISQSNISRIENGNNTPCVATLKKIADGLGRRLEIKFRSYEEVL